MKDPPEASDAGPLPRLRPMLATSSTPFDDEDYLFETKWDGVRALAAVAKGAWQVWGREGQSYTERYPELAALLCLPPGTLLDGELVLLREGRAHFDALMSRHHRRAGQRIFANEPIHFMVFDLLYLAGRSLLGLPLLERRKLLRQHLPAHPVLTGCDGVIGTGRQYFARVVAQGHGALWPSV